MSDLGPMLRAGRLAAELTQRAAAEKLGVDFTYVSKIECGVGRFAPSDDLIQGFAALYGLDADDLFVAAGKCPPDLHDRLSRDRAFVQRVRSMGDPVGESRACQCGHTKFSHVANMGACGVGRCKCRSFVAA